MIAWLVYGSPRGAVCMLQMNLSGRPSPRPAQFWFLPAGGRPVLGLKGRGPPGSDLLTRETATWLLGIVTSAC